MNCFSQLENGIFATEKDIQELKNNSSTVYNKAKLEAHYTLWGCYFMLVNKKYIYEFGV